MHKNTDWLHTLNKKDGIEKLVLREKNMKERLVAFIQVY